jgi:hypothetical protein
MKSVIILLCHLPLLQASCAPGYQAQNISLAVLSDSVNHVIYTYDLGTHVTTPVAGTFGTPGYADGASSLLNQPFKAVLTPDGTGIVFADKLNMVIRKVDLASRSVSTVAGAKYTYVYGVTTTEATALDGAGSAASFYQPEYIQFSSDGSRFLVSTESAATVRAVTYPGFVTSTVLGIATYPWGSTDGVLYQGGLFAGGTCTLSADGTFYLISDRVYRNIRKITISSSLVTTIAGARDGASNPGCDDGFDARFDQPVAQVSTSSYAFVVDVVGLTIRRIDLATYEVSTFAGLCETAGTADGIGTDARFTYPMDIAMSGSYLYVPDLARIRKIDSTTALVTSLTPPAVAGTYFVFIDIRISTSCAPCAAGYDCSNGVATPCPQHHFCPAGIATPCPGQSVTLATGATSYLGCQCPAGTYGQVTGPTTSNCTPCPVGKFCSPTATSCAC